MGMVEDGFIDVVGGDEDRWHEERGSAYRYDPDEWREPPRPAIKPSDDPSVWVGRHGAKPLKDMSDVHLARALATTVDKDGLQHPRAKALLAELRKRSELPCVNPLALPTCVGVGEDF